MRMIQETPERGHSKVIKNMFFEIFFRVNIVNFNELA